MVKDNTTRSKLSKKHNCGIYLISVDRSIADMPNSYYIGQSIRVKSRLADHKRFLSNDHHANVHLLRAWKKYGEHSFNFQMIVCCEEEYLVENEQRVLDDYIATYGQDRVLNILKECRPGRIGAVLSEETKRKMSASIRAANLNPETKEKHRRNAYNRHALRTPEERALHNAKISAGLKARLEKLAN